MILWGRRQPDLSLWQMFAWRGSTVQAPTELIGTFDVQLILASQFDRQNILTATADNQLILNATFDAEAI